MAMRDPSFHIRVDELNGKVQPEAFFRDDTAIAASLVLENPHLPQGVLVFTPYVRRVGVSGASHHSIRATGCCRTARHRSRYRNNP